MADSFQYDVFLSHSSKDKATVRPIAERLRTDSLHLWFDDWDTCPDGNIGAKIADADAVPIARRGTLSLGAQSRKRTSL